MLEVDGNKYPVNSLPGDIQEMIATYQTWEQELNQQRLDTFKTEAAMRAVSAEIQSRIRVMVANAAAAKEAAQAHAANDDQAPSDQVQDAVESEGGTPD